MGVFLKWLYVPVSQLLLGYIKKKKNTGSLVTFPLKKAESMEVHYCLIEKSCLHTQGMHIASFKL